MNSYLVEVVLVERLIERLLILISFEGAEAIVASCLIEDPH